jgi:hypothetical protein
MLFMAAIGHDNFVWSNGGWTGLSASSACVPPIRQVRFQGAEHDLYPLGSLQFGKPGMVRNWCRARLGYPAIECGIGWRLQEGLTE